MSEIRLETRRTIDWGAERVRGEIVLQASGPGTTVLWATDWFDLPAPPKGRVALIERLQEQAEAQLICAMQSMIHDHGAGVAGHVHEGSPR